MPHKLYYMLSNGEKMSIDIVKDSESGEMKAVFGFFGEPSREVLEIEAELDGKGVMLNDIIEYAEKRYYKIKLAGKMNALESCGD